jgi:TPR repeat protein
MTGHPKEGFHAYERAAQLGEVGGVAGMAWHYATGSGAPMDHARAFELYQQAYDRGDTRPATKRNLDHLREELGK